MALAIIAATDDATGAWGATEWLSAANVVHRQLRAQLPPEREAYLAVLQPVLTNGGRICLAVDGKRVKGLALWRVVENTCDGRRLYVDDLVVDAACRSQGIGKALINWLEDRARALGCVVLALDSGVQRGDAHRFYFREAFTIPSFCFRKKII